MSQAHSQTLSNDSTCCVPCKSLKKALIVKTERDYLKNQIGITRDSIFILDSIVHKQDLIIVNREAKITECEKSEAACEQLVKNKDKEVELYKGAYNTAIRQRNVGYTFGFLGIILVVLSNIL